MRCIQAAFIFWLAHMGERQTNIHTYINTHTFHKTISSVHPQPAVARVWFKKMIAATLLNCGRLVK